MSKKVMNQVWSIRRSRNICRTWKNRRSPSL